MNACEDEIITIMYDTTTREQIEGEWAVFLVKFASDNSTHRLRSLSMAFEDHSNIVLIFVEQIERLALAVNTTAAEIWVRVTAIMTDSVGKNLKIAPAISKAIGTDPSRWPLQLLCTAHSCEVMDKKCLELCMETENHTNIKGQILGKMPGLGAFFRAKKSVVEVAVEAITKLILNTGLKTSLYKEFLDVCDEHQVSRKIGAYKQRRFAKLGYCAGSIVHHLPEIRALLEKFHGNQLSQACKLYLSIPYIIEAMQSLSIITEFVILPYLEMVQKYDNVQLLTILPQLHHDLLENDLKTLTNFHTPFKFAHPEPNENVTLLVNLMAKRIADGLSLQRGREFGFPSTSTAGTEPRATDLSSGDIPEHILKQLPTHNLDCERELGVFDHKVTKSSGGYNRFSTLKGLRDDMMLHKANFNELSRNQFDLYRKLDSREEKWNEGQEMKRVEKRTLKEQEAIKVEERWKNHLTTCRTWGGPCDSLATMRSIEEKIRTPQEMKKFLKTEILFNKLSNFQPTLEYGVNSKTNEELKRTLESILTYEESTESRKSLENDSNVSTFLKSLIAKQ